jgi:hypothetical protein
MPTGEKIQSKPRPAPEASARREFLVMNSRLEYFCGFGRGGKMLWLDDHSMAKPLDDERKFRTMQRLCPDSLAMGWCDEGAARKRPARKNNK